MTQRPWFAARLFRRSLIKASAFSSFSTFSFDAFDCGCPFPENSRPYDCERLAQGLHLHERCVDAMLKISILDTPSKRELLIEGKLVGPWATELARVWRQATVDLNGPCARY
jgi:hypothetical protein